MDAAAWQWRSQGAFALFYLIDVLLLAAYGALGTLPMRYAWAYAAAAALVMTPTVVLLKLHPRKHADLVTLWQTLAACALMLATAAAAPEAGVLLLMTVITVVASSALKVSRSGALLCWGLIASGAVAVIVARSEPLSLPWASLAERLLSAIWFVWILAKGVAVTAVGTAMRRRIYRANVELAAALARVEVVAARDDLTVLPNRRAILASLEFALRARPEIGYSLGVALLDIDHFKNVNDRYGHALGDDVLRGFAHVMAGSLRPFDQVGRYGGEEFLLVLQQVRDGTAAREASDRVRRAIEQHDWQHLAPGLRLTASIGVTFLRPGDTTDSMIRRADAALYAAKNGGRNRVVLG